MGETCYDKRGIPIERGDIVKVFHFIGARRRRHYMFKQCLGADFLHPSHSNKYVFFSHLNFQDDRKKSNGPYTVSVGEHLPDYEIVQSIKCDHEQRDRTPSPLAEAKCKLTELLDRVKAATGPDRELDAAIEVSVRRVEAYRAGLSDEQRAKWRGGANGVVTDDFTTYYAYTFTASVDAALALTDRVLPGAEMHITLNHPKNDWQTASIRVAPLKLVSGEEATLPLAIIAATLSALLTLQK